MYRQLYTISKHTDSSVFSLFRHKDIDFYRAKGIIRKKCVEFLH